MVSLICYHISRYHGDYFPLFSRFVFFFRIFVCFHHFPSCSIVYQNLESFFRIFITCHNFSLSLIHFHHSHLCSSCSSSSHHESYHITKLTWWRKAHAVSLSLSRFCNGEGGCAPPNPPRGHFTKHIHASICHHISLFQHDFSSVSSLSIRHFHDVPHVLQFSHFAAMFGYCHCF